MMTLIAYGNNAVINVPQRDGFVTDVANKLSDLEEEKLEQKLSHLHDTEGKDIAILIVPSLQSVGASDISDLGYVTGNAWGVGNEVADDGVLLSIALSDRKLRIDTGKGVEGDLTDSECKQIIDLMIKPHFKRERFYEGINQGVDEIASQLTNVEIIQQENVEKPSAFLLILVFVVIFIIVAFGMFGEYKSKTTNQKSIRSWRDLKSPKKQHTTSRKNSNSGFDVGSSRYDDSRGSGNSGRGFGGGDFGGGGSSGSW